MPYARPKRTRITHLTLSRGQTELGSPVPKLDSSETRQRLCPARLVTYRASNRLFRLEPMQSGVRRQWLIVKATAFLAFRAAVRPPVAVSLSQSMAIIILS